MKEGGKVVSKELCSHYVLWLFGVESSELWITGRVKNSAGRENMR